MSQSLLHNQKAVTVRAKRRGSVEAVGGLTADIAEASAQIEDLPVVTTGQAFRKYGVLRPMAFLIDTSVAIHLCDGEPRRATHSAARKPRYL